MVAARLADPAVVKRLLLAQASEEYHEVVRLMEADDCV